MDPRIEPEDAEVPTVVRPNLRRTVRFVTKRQDAICLNAVRAVRISVTFQNVMEVIAPNYL